MDVLKLLLVFSIFNGGQLKDVCKSPAIPVACHTDLKMTNHNITEYEYGDTIHFTCEVLNETSIDSSLFFLWHERSKTKIPFTNIRGKIGYKDVKVISNESGGTYSCRYGNCTVDGLRTLHYVKIDTLSIPKKNGSKVPKMKCRVYDLINMSCGWTVPKDHVGTTRWSAMYKSEAMDIYRCCTVETEENCTSSGGRRECFIPDSNFMRFIPYNITLTEISEAETHLYHYTVIPDNTIESVNINDDVRVEPGDTPNSLVAGFTLHHPPNAVGGMICDVSYKPIQEYGIVQNSTFSMCQGNLDVNITLDKISPFTTYAMNISCKPQFSPYWSNQVSGSGQTNRLVPSTKVNTAHTAATKTNKSKTIAIATSCSMIILCLLICVLVPSFRKRLRNIMKNNTVSDEMMERILEDSPEKISPQVDICSESSETSGVYSICSSLTDDQTNVKSLESQQVRTNESCQVPAPKMEMHLYAPTSYISRSMSNDYLIPAVKSKNDPDERHTLFATRNVRQNTSDITTNLDNPCNDLFENTSGSMACDSYIQSGGEYNKAVCLPLINYVTLFSNGYLEAQPNAAYNNISSNWDAFDSDHEISEASFFKLNDFVDVPHTNVSFWETISSCDKYTHPGEDEDVFTSMPEYQRADSMANFSSIGDMQSNNSEYMLASDFADSNVATGEAAAYNESFDDYCKADNSGQSNRNEVMTLGSTDSTESIESMGEDMTALSTTFNNSDNETSEIDTTSGFWSGNGQRHCKENNDKMVNVFANDNSNNLITAEGMDAMTIEIKNPKTDNQFSKEDIKKALDSFYQVLESDDDQESEIPFDSYAMVDIAYQNDGNINDTTAYLEDYVTISSQ